MKEGCESRALVGRPVQTWSCGIPGQVGTGCAWVGRHQSSEQTNKQTPQQGGMLGCLWCSWIWTPESFHHTQLLESQGSNKHKGHPEGTPSAPRPCISHSTPRMCSSAASHMGVLRVLHDPGAPLEDLGNLIVHAAAGAGREARFSCERATNVRVFKLTLLSPSSTPVNRL